MKRVRKYTYLPQEEIEVIETKSGETIKSKEILDGNYIKSKPAPKKVVKKAVKKVVKKKYDNGGEVSEKFVKEAVDYLNYNGFAEIVSDGKGGWLVSYLDEDENYKDVKYDSEGVVQIALDKRFMEDENDREEDEYAKGGVMPKGARSGIKIKNWYVKNYPTDELGEDINDTITFKGYWAMTSQGYNPYEVLGVEDSVVRERVDGKLSEILGVDNYEYKKGGKLVGNQKNLDVNKNGKLDAEYFKMLRGEKMAHGGSVQDIEEYVAKKYFNGDESGFSVSKNMKGKYELYIDNHERFEADYGDYVEETKKIEDDINSKFANGGKVGKVGMYQLMPYVNMGEKFSSPSFKETINFEGTQDEAINKANNMVDNSDRITSVEVSIINPKATNVLKMTKKIEMVRGTKMAKGGKTPIVRTQFEEEEFEYADGGIPSQIPSRIVRNAAKAASKDGYDYNIYYNKEDKEFSFSRSSLSDFYKNETLVGLVSSNGEVTKYADGGKVTDKEVADSNVHMLQSNIKSIKHHAEELENAIKDNTEVEGWVLAKADRAATAMSDITHYIDGRKLGSGGMVAGHYYKDKAGSDLRYIGPDSKNDDLGIFKNGEKYLTKSFDDFEEEKEKKSFWFGNGGFMPSGFSRKVSLSEKAEEMVGKNTWHILDAAQKGEVIGELISDGALAVTMDRGGIIDAEDWSKSMTQDKIYALKKAGYSENIASEMSLLPYEQLPMWVRQDFKKASIVIGAYHIHNNANTSGLMIDDNILIDGKVLVLDGEGIVVFYADTLEEAKDWAYREIQHQKEMDDEFADEDERVGERDYADGGVTEVTKFKVVYKLKDAAEPKEKLFDNAEKAEFFLETIQEDDDIESANLVEVKPMKKATEKKAPTNLFAAAKPAAASSASKKTKEDVLVPGIADRIARYDALKAIIKNAEAEKEVIGGSLKEVGKEKFLELYELRRRNPETFNLADEDEKIMFIVMDKYIKVEPEKAGMLENYPGLLETTTTYKFNPALLDKTGEIVSRLIMESTELSDDEKANLIVAETKIGIKSGSIDRLMDYDNPSQIFDLIEPILALK